MLTLTVGVLAALAVASLIIKLDSTDPFSEAKDFAKSQERLRKVIGGAK